MNGFVLFDYRRIFPITFSFLYLLYVHINIKIYDKIKSIYMKMDISTNYIPLFQIQKATNQIESYLNSSNRFCSLT